MKVQPHRVGSRRRRRLDVRFLKHTTDFDAKHLPPARTIALDRFTGKGENAERKEVDSTGSAGTALPAVRLGVRFVQLKAASLRTARPDRPVVLHREVAPSTARHDRGSTAPGSL